VTGKSQNVEEKVCKPLGGSGGGGGSAAALGQGKDFAFESRGLFPEHRSDSRTVNAQCHMPYQWQN
jgi:hypothetical protein